MKRPTHAEAHAKHERIRRIFAEGQLTLPELAVIFRLHRSTLERIVAPVRARLRLGRPNAATIHNSRLQHL